MRLSVVQARNSTSQTRRGSTQRTPLSAPAGSELASFGFFAAMLSSAVRSERADSFGMLGAGLNVTHKLTEAWSLVGNAAALGRLYPGETRFDQLTVDGNLGARWARGKEAITVGAQLQSFELDWARFRETTGALVQWQHAYDERRQASVFGQYSQLRYPTQSIRDANREVIGVAYGQAFSATYSPVVFTSAYVGREAELAPDVAHLGHKLFGWG